VGWADTERSTHIERMKKKKRKKNKKKKKALKDEA
jgi:hypothetical protein